jgi:4'-phosphopantetheinyl transferase
MLHHLWLVPLDDPAFQVPERLALLDDAERRRAARFHFARDAQRWSAAHVALREVLSAHCGRAAASLRFAAQADGKPYLELPEAPAFNLSHSDGLALIAVGGTLPLGVDIEAIRPVPEMAGVAESHFAEDERRVLFDLPERDRLDAFYRIWTRKEAYVKATGVGIGPALAKFSVTVDAADVRLLRDEHAPDATTRWSLHAVEVPAEYRAALVLHAPHRAFDVRWWR